MRGTVAKRLRKKVYGDQSRHGVVYLYNHLLRCMVCDGLRATYRQYKKLFKNTRKLGIKNFV